MFRHSRALALICGLAVISGVVAQAPPTDLTAPPEIPRAIRDRLPEPGRVETVAPMPVPAQLPAPPATAPPAQPSPAPSNADEGPKRETPGPSEPMFLSQPEETKRFPLEASWENGLWFETTNKQFRIHVGGNAQVDSTWLIGPHGVFAIPSGGQNGVENSSAIFLRR